MRGFAFPATANARVATPLLRAGRGVHVQPVNHGRYAPEDHLRVWQFEERDLAKDLGT